MSITTDSTRYEPKLNVGIKVSIGDHVLAILISSLLMSGVLFASLFAIWWFQAPFEPTPFVDPLDTIIIFPKDDLAKDTKLSIVEFDNSEIAAFEKAVEMSGTSIASVVQVNGLSGDGVTEIHGIDQDKRQLLPERIVAPKWSVIHEAADLESYQQKLDFFKIEIGAVHQFDDRIWRISQLSIDKIVSESTREAESGYRYFVNKQKRLQQLDLQTITQAGLDVEHVIAVHFYPNDLVSKMQQLIDFRYGDRASDLQEVTFKIAGASGNFRFEIDDVKFGDQLR